MTRRGYTEVTVDLPGGHKATFDVPTESMIPGGKTCRDCRWFRRCVWLVSTRPGNTYCDWAPHRFQEGAHAR